MEQFFTYLHCKPNGEPFYVGKGKKKRSHNFHGRILHHRNIVAKYGAENILVYVFPCDSEEQALDDEVRQIACLKREGFELVNITAGGKGSSGNVRSKETIEKNRKANIGRRHSEESKKKMSISASKWKRSEEMKKKLSDYAKNRTDEHKKKVAESARTRKKVSNSGQFKIGQKVSAETRAKMSARMKGNTLKKDFKKKKISEALVPFDANHLR